MGFSIVFTCFRLAMVFIFCPLAMCIVESSFTSWIPSQNEPNVSQGSPLSSITKLGSMAVHSSRYLMMSGAHTWLRNPATESCVHFGITLIAGVAFTVQVFKSFEVAC